MRTRLLKISRENGQNYELILIRYANERFLYRLSQSEHAHRFVLKGAMLLMSWLGVLFRGSRDVDMLGYGDTDPKTVLAVFQDIFAQEADDGVCFDAKGAQVSRIREDGVHGGLRIKTTADIDGARIQVRIDIGFGDITEPKPKMLDLPGLLDMPTAPLRGYARETVIAEKFEAMVSLGLSNSRTKDYYDIWLLSQSFDFDQTQLGRSIAATFENRGTVIPAKVPEVLTVAYSDNEARQRQWEAFVQDVSVNPESLQHVIETIAGFLMPAAAIARKFAAEQQADRS